MAHSRALTRFQPRPIIVNVPRRRGRVRRAARAVAHHARRGYHRGKGHLPVIALTVASAAVGWAEGAGHLDFAKNLIGGKEELGLALVGYGVTRFFTNKYARWAGVAMMMKAGYDLGSERGTHGDGAER